MKVDAKLLWQAMKNLSLFSAKKTFADGVSVRSTGTGLLFQTSDNFVGIEVFIDTQADLAVEQFFIRQADVSTLEKALRGAEGERGLRVDSVAGDVVVLEDYGPIGQVNQVGDPNWWSMFETLFDNLDDKGRMVPPFAISGQRLSKLSLLEPKNTYPLDISGQDIATQTFVKVKYGPDTVVLISPLDPDKLADVYTNISDVRWS